MTNFSTGDTSHCRPTRAQKASLRAADADAAMRECRLCGWDCGVDRTGGPAGHCRAGAHPLVFQNRLEWVGEARLIPTRLINFSGCNFRCSFCLTGRDSQDAGRGKPLDMAALARSLQDDAPHYRTVTIEGGETSIFLPDALRVAALVPDGVPVVWKTNAYSSDVALAMLRGCIDVFLADYKFGNDACAMALAGVPDYLAHVRRNLRWGRGHSDLIVRHLVMPGHVRCCLAPVLTWLKAEMPEVKLSLVNGFTPLWNSKRNPELLNPLSEDERQMAQDLVSESGLELASWAVAPATENFSSAIEPPDDNIYIDRQGRIRVPFMTADLQKCLSKLENEFPMAVNFL